MEQGAVIFPSKLMRNAFFDEVTDPKTLLIKNKKKSQCPNFRYLSLEGFAVPIILPRSDILR